MTDEMRRRQVLVVEDDPSLRNLYTTTLSRLDVDLFEAPDGAVAVRRFSAGIDRAPGVSYAYFQDFRKCRPD